MTWAKHTSFHTRMMRHWWVLFPSVPLHQAKKKEVDVVVKRLPGNDTILAKKKFLAEAEKLQMFSHPNVVKLHCIAGTQVVSVSTQFFFPGRSWLCSATNNVSVCWDQVGTFHALLRRRIWVWLVISSHQPAGAGLCWWQFRGRGPVRLIEVVELIMNLWRQHSCM